MDQLLMSAKTALGQPMRVSGLRSFSAKVAAYDWRELQFCEHLSGFPGQARFSVKFETRELKRSGVQPALSSEHRTEAIRAPSFCC
jgi:hypothetical protein